MWEQWYPPAKTCLNSGRTTWCCRSRCRLPASGQYRHSRWGLCSGCTWWFPGVVEGFTDKSTRIIRYRADAPQLIAIQVTHHPIILHRYALTIGIVVADVLCDRVGDIREVGAIGLGAGLSRCTTCGLNIPFNLDFVVISDVGGHFRIRSEVTFL